MKNSPFRTWLYAKWYQYKDEMLDVERVKVETNAEAYFAHSKWFLKQIYKAEKNKNADNATKRN